MTTLKEIKGKEYLKCDVSITLTTKKSKLFFLTKFGQAKNDLRLSKIEMPIISDSINIFLDITHETKDIKFGDFIIYKSQAVRVISMDDMFLTLSDNQMIAKNKLRKKLIATTRKVNFFKGSVSTSFLEVYTNKYQKNEPIETVHVEYIGDFPKLNKKSEVSILKVVDNKLSTIGKHQYSLTEFDTYEMRYKFEAISIKTNEQTNFDIYSTNTNVAEVEKIFIDKIIKSDVLTSGKLVHKATREQDDNTAKFLNSFLN